MSNSPQRKRPRIGRVVATVLVALFVIAVYLFLYAPLTITALFSVNDSTIQTLPFSGFTGKWYSALAHDDAMKTALLYSLKVAFVSVAISAVAALYFALTI